MRAACVALLLLGAPACATPQPEESSLVCRVEADMAAYAGQTLTLSGHLVTDFHHGYGLAAEACPDAYLPLGRETRDAVGKRAFFEAWQVGRSCPTDPLRVTVIGNVGSVEVDGRTYPIFITSEYRDIHRAPGSQCPMTYEQLEARMAQ